MLDFPSAQSYFSTHQELLGIKTRPCYLIVKDELAY